MQADLNMRCYKDILHLVSVALLCASEVRGKLSLGQRPAGTTLFSDLQVYQH